MHKLTFLPFPAHSHLPLLLVLQPLLKLGYYQVSCTISAIRWNKQQISATAFHVKENENKSEAQNQTKFKFLVNPALPRLCWGHCKGTQPHRTQWDWPWPTSMRSCNSFSIHAADGWNENELHYSILAKWIPAIWR